MDWTQTSGGKDRQGVYEEELLLFLTQNDFVRSVNVGGLSGSEEKKRRLPVPVSQLRSTSLQAGGICWSIMQRAAELHQSLHKAVALGVNWDQALRSAGRIQTPATGSNTKVHQEKNKTD